VLRRVGDGRPDRDGIDMSSMSAPGSVTVPAVGGRLARHTSCTARVAYRLPAASDRR